MVFLLRWENWSVWFKDTVQVNENSRCDLDMQRFITDVEKPETKAGCVEVEIESCCCDLPMYTASRFGWFPHLRRDRVTDCQYRMKMLFPLYLNQAEYLKDSDFIILYLKSKISRRRHSKAWICPYFLTSRH
jgi:hypothetical protein